MTRYLNYNSTFITGGKFNPSDIYYQDNIELHTKEEIIKNYLKEYVNAPDTASVIFNSGASESIANMFLWAKEISKFGVVVGSILDHPTVKENADNFGMEYTMIDFKKNEITLPEDTVMMFITGVSPKTGEIFPMSKIKKYNYLSEHEDSINNTVRQIKPLKVLDASQMIGKIKIDMIKDDLNAVFFSCHKFGGEFNTGVLIVNDGIIKYKPLIAGSQQEHMRGGTYNAYAYQNINKLLNEYSSQYNEKECKEIYETFIKELDKNKIEYYKPKLNHLYNTILIHLHGCNAKAIHTLAEYGIYVGSSTACTNSKKVKELRISYLNKSEFGKNTISKICKIIKEVDIDDNDDNEIDKDDDNDKIDDNNKIDNDDINDKNDNKILDKENGEIEEEIDKVNKLNDILKFEEEYI